LRAIRAHTVYDISAFICHSSPTRIAGESMNELFRNAQGVISAAAANPLALAALLLLVVAFVIVALRVRRYKHLLRHLGSLPENDRLKALEMEMGVVKVRKGLSPQQWLKYNLRKYFFYGFLIVCLTLVVLVAMLLHHSGSGLKTNAGVDVSLAPSESVEVPASDPTGGSGNTAVSTLIQTSTTWGEPQMAEQQVPKEREVMYRSRLDDGVSRITYEVDYLYLVRQGGLVSGVNYLGSPFKWRFPELSVKVVNNSRHNVVLSRALLEVQSSEIIDEPIPVIEDMSVNKLVIHNEGWGDMIDPTVELVVSEELAEGEVPVFAPATHTVNLKTFAVSDEIPLEGYVPERLRGSSFVSVCGIIEYGKAAQRKKLRFRTRVSLQIRAAVGIPPSRFYDTFLQAGQAPVIEQVDVAQEIRPGEADHFLIRLGTDKSSRKRIKISFLTADGEVLPGGELTIDLFVPRTAGKTILTQRLPR